MSGGSDALIGSRAIVVATRFAECSPECEPAAAAGAAAAEAAGGVGLQLSMLRLCVGDGGSGASGGGGAGGEPSSSIGLERSEDGLPPPPPHAAAVGLPEGGGVAGGGGLTSSVGGLAASASAIASGSLCSRVTSVRHSCCASVVEKKPRYSSFALCFTCAAADGGGGRRDAGEPGSSVKSTMLPYAVDDTSTELRSARQSAGHRQSPANGAPTVLARPPTTFASASDGQRRRFAILANPAQLSPSSSSSLT